MMWVGCVYYAELYCTVHVTAAALCETTHLCAICTAIVLTSTTQMLVKGHAATFVIQFIITALRCSVNYISGCNSTGSTTAQ